MELDPLLVRPLIYVLILFLYLKYFSKIIAQHQNEAISNIIITPLTTKSACKNMPIIEKLCPALLPASVVASTPCTAVETGERVAASTILSLPVLKIPYAEFFG